MESDEPSAESDSAAWVRHVLGFLALLVAYFAVPYGHTDSMARATAGVVASLLAVGLAGWVITWQMLVERRGGGRQVQLRGLLLLLEIIIVAFAGGYYGLDRAADDQLVGLETRLDALYFTLSTLSTVGYGDVHAVGQAARAVVSVQIVFDVLFVGALASLATGRFRGAPAASHRHSRSSGEDL